MKYLPLVWANLRRKRVRTVLTLLSVVVAFLLFGLIEAIGYALTGGAELAGQDRLVTQHRVSLIQYLPLSYLDRIRAIDGVKVVTSQDWFGGIYRDDRNQITATAVEPESFFEVYPEMAPPSEQMQVWHTTRTAAVVGSDIAERFGWKLGDKVPMRSSIFRKRDGSDTWDLDIAGIYHVDNGDNTNVFFQYDYLNEARTYGHDEIGWIIMRIADPNRAPAIEEQIDKLFANSSTETRTTTESAFLQGFANQMGNIGRIVTIVAVAVFFTMLLVTANAMAQSVRERVRDIAVMRTLGFSNGSVVLLVLAEGLTITVAGGLIGLWLGDALAKSMGKQMAQFLPLMMTPPNSYGTGMLLAVGLGVLSCAIPCLQVWRLEIVEQLRRA
ncbi:MAG: ABC transporter permease [Gammaproteobacteria bacterium]